MIELIKDNVLYIVVFGVLFADLAALYYYARM